MEISPDEIFSVSDKQGFEQLALKIFQLQADRCLVYRNFIDHLGIDPLVVSNFKDIPYLPVSFFKTHLVSSSSSDIIFLSSATTGTVQSQHPVKDLNIYERSYRSGFEYFYGDIDTYCILALLPSYQERKGSSLIYMVDDLIAKSNHPQSGYFLDENEKLFESLNELKSARQKTILIGVTYALLDFVERYQMNFPSLLVMETGGMKGKRKEMIRQELHQVLCEGFGVAKIHSEYGMTELLSQAYSHGEGLFRCPPWMDILIRDVNDPLSFAENCKTGGINVIDLANIHSCSFISTQDLGRKTTEGFEILGRFDESDIRGCNLLVQ